MQLQSLVTHPALSGLLSIFLITGIIYSANYALKWIWKDSLGHLESFCGAVILIALISMPVYIGINLNIPIILYSKFTGWFFVAVAFFNLARFAYAKSRWQKILDQCRLYARWSISGIDAFLISFVLLMLFLTSLGPPTDADSLDYHIGGPIRILLGSLSFPSNDWLISRLILLGESFNTIGLAIGTDNVNAILQLLALLWMCYLMGSLLVTDKGIKRSVVVKLATIPLFLLFLISSQKPQFSGVVAVVTAAILISTTKIKTPLTYFLSVGAIFYALSIKYPFYVTAFIPWCFIAVDAYKEKKLKIFLLANTVFYLVLLFPIHLMSVLKYGSPMSPLLSGVFHEPGSLDYIRSWNLTSTNYTEGFGFPLGLLIPSSPGLLSTCIGIGIFTFYFVDWKNKKAAQLLWVSLGTFVLTATFCQPVSRYFADSYYLAIAAFAIAPKKRKLFWLFDLAGTAQLGVLALSAVIGVYLIFPGALSWGQRDKVLSRTANGYNEAKFLDEHLPANAALIQTSRSNAFNPRPYLASDYLFMMKYFPIEFKKRLDQFSGKRIFYTLGAEINVKNVLYATLKSNVTFLAPPELPIEMRNPFNNSTRRRLYIYELDYEKLQRLDLKNVLKARIEFGGS